MGYMDFKKLIQEKFFNIEFNEEKHIYKVKGEEYISTTTLLKQFVPEFNTEEISKKVSEKTGVNQQDLIQEWREKGDNAREIGTALHKYIENDILNLPQENLILEDSHLIKSFLKKTIQFEKFKEEHLKTKQLIGSEIIVYDEEYKIAGTIDALYYNEINNSFWFIDWKSNRKISDSNKYSNLLPPLQKYENSSLIQYSLQLSVYRYIVEKYILKDLPDFQTINTNSLNVIVNFPENEDTYKIYYTQYLRYSTQQLLNIRKKQLKGN